MEYQALYRKYRPQRFSEVVGQEHVTSTLARELVEDRVAHAYLFAGPRGTGKTTTARLLAKALNCRQRGADGEPCNTCPSCLAVAEGSSLDVIELDAASHNKVEDIREIRMNVGTVASVSGARRVYILDEAHMLSKAAGNALLKTLEEPPGHVHFVLATTEPYKLADTIRSRAQRFDFHPVASDTLADYLARVAAAEGFRAEEDSLGPLARHAGGSVRDALSLLEQVAALGGGDVELGGIDRALGLAGREAFPELARAVAQQDARAALELVAKLASEGADLRRFVSEALGFFRGVFLVQYAPNLEEVVDDPSDVLSDWRAVARELSPADVLRIIDLLGEALLQLREGREERLVVELALLKLTRPETAAAEPGALAARLDRLEERVRQLAEAEPGRGPEAAGPPGRRTDLVPTQLEEPEAPAQPPPSAAAVAVGQEPPEPTARLTPAQVESAWPALIGAIREQAGPRRHAFFREVTPGGVEGATIVLNVPGHLSFHLEQLRQDDRLRDMVEQTAGKLFGGSVRVEYRAAEAATGGETDEEVPDKDRLMEAADDGDPSHLLMTELGGEVVEEAAGDSP